MSNDEGKNLYQQYDPFHYNQLDMNRSIFHQQALDPAFMSFTNFFDTSLDYNSLSRAFDVSCSSSEVISPVDDKSKSGGVGGKSLIKQSSTTTPNSSVSSSSNEAAAAEEDSFKSNKEDTKGSENNKDEEKSKKQYVFFLFFSFSFCF